MTIEIDIIGLIYSPLVLDDDGEVISGGTPVAGWHVNTVQAVAEWSAWRIYPVTKRVVFSGLPDETICYKFADEAEFLAMSAGIIE